MEVKVKDRGFTFLELMITVAIVSILAAVSIVNIRSYIARTVDTATLVDLRSTVTAVNVILQDLPDPGNSGGAFADIRSQVPGFQISKTTSNVCYQITNHSLLYARACTSQGTKGGYDYIGAIIIDLPIGGCSC
jgi:prepilin-type N-terminal cleavage/methylation domain-containing protein